MKRVVAAAVIALSLSACSDTTRTGPFDRASGRTQAATVGTAATGYPAPARCRGTDRLEFAVAFDGGGAEAAFDGTNTITYDALPVQKRAYVTVTSCHGVLATVTTTSWGWDTSVADPAEDCPGLTIVPPTKEYVYASGAPASCTPDNVMDSIRSDGEVDNSSGVGASLSIAPDPTTSVDGRYPYLAGFAEITSFGRYGEASGAWRVVALDANGRDIGERTLYQIAHP